MTTPYRSSTGRAGRCARGHMHGPEAIGGHCCIPPCIGVGQPGGWPDAQWDHARKIEAVEVHPDSKRPNTQYEP